MASIMISSVLLHLEWDSWVFVLSVAADRDARMWTIHSYGYLYYCTLEILYVIMINWQKWKTNFDILLKISLMSFKFPGKYLRSTFIITEIICFCMKFLFWTIPIHKYQDTDTFSCVRTYICTRARCSIRRLGTLELHWFHLLIIYKANRKVNCVIFLLSLFFSCAPCFGHSCYVIS